MIFVNEFDKCNFCESYGEIYENECTNPCCWRHSCYLVDANKVLKKAYELKISVTDVLNLIRECNR